MEYSDTYHIERIMHARPLAEVVREVLNLEKKYCALEIFLEDPKTKESYGNSKSLMSLLSKEKFYRGGNVLITAKGEYSLKALKKCVGNVGNIFSD